MDSISEKNCLEEISHMVFDQQEKVSLKTISNNWEVPNRDALKVLEKWLKQNKEKELSKEYFVNGVTKKDQAFISIIAEENLKKVEKKTKSFETWLFSVEIKSEGRKLNIPDQAPIKVKNIKIEVGTRNIALKSAPVKSVPEVKKEPVKEVPKPSTSSEVKKEKKTPETKQQKSAEKPDVKKEVPKEIKKEEASTKKSPEEPKKSPAKAKGGVKNAKPVTKGSITSFFNKPAGSKPVVKKEEQDSKIKEKTTPVEKKSPPVKEKSPPIKKEKSPEPEKNRKRHIDVISDDEEIPCTPEEKKKPKKVQKKLKLKNESNKRSRIMQIEDSSESEQENLEEPEKKLIKFDRELTPEAEEPEKGEVEEVKSEKKKEPEKKVGNGDKKKAKAKRMVTKTYEDEDGFIKTVREMEEYTASEDEDPSKSPKENEKPNQSKKPAKKTPIKKSPAKKSAPPSKTKQGSIMSFFTKK